MRTALVASFLVIVLISSVSFALSPVAGAAPRNLSLTEWPVPTSGAGLAGITVDNGGRVWFTENASKLGMLDPLVGKIYEWNCCGTAGHNIVTGQAGAFGGTSNRVYFAEYDRDRIAFLDNVTGTTYVNWLTEWQLTGGSKPVSVAVDRVTGDIWFTESYKPLGGSPGLGAIGRLTVTTASGQTPTAQLTEWKLPPLASTTASTPCNCAPWGIALNRTIDASGTHIYVWFTELTGGTNGRGAIGRLDATTNILTVWDLGVSPLNGVKAPTDITVDSHSGNVYWVNTGSGGNSISVLSNLNVYKEYSLITTSAIPSAPTVDAARSALWSVEYATSKVAYLDLTATTLSSLVPTAGQCTIGLRSAGQPTQCSTVSGVSTTSLTALQPGDLGTPFDLRSLTVTSVSAVNSGSLSAPNGPMNGVYEYGLLSASSGPYSMFVDANENLWITESSSIVNRIAEIQFPVDFSIALTSSSSQSVPQGGSATYSVSVTPATGLQTPVTLSVNAPGVLSASFSTSPGTPPFTSTLTISTGGSTPPSTYPMTITGTSSSASHSVSISLTVSTQIVTTTTSTGCGFDYQLTADQTSQTIQEGSSGSYQLDVLQTCPTVSQLPVTLSVTTPTGVTAQFTNNGQTPSYDTQLLVDVSVDAPVTTSGTISVSGLSPAHSLTLTVQITAVPRDFTVTGPGSVSLYQASRGDIALSVTSVGAFSGPVQFTVPSVSGLTGSVSPNPVNLEPTATVASTLEIVADKNVAPGTYTLTATGAATTPQGPISHDFQVSVTVTSGLPCLIATATFGSPLAPEVQFLRGFRDNQIMHTFAGLSFMTVFNAWYYSFSPSVANYENLHPGVKAPMQYFLMPLLGSLHVSSWTYASIAGLNSELAVLISGLIASSLIGLLYLALPLAATIWVLRRKVLTRAANVTVMLAKFFAASISLMTVLFAVSELLGLGVTMMVASASIVLLGLAAGCALPAFALIERFYKRW